MKAVICASVLQPPRCPIVYIFMYTYTYQGVACFCTLSCCCPPCPFVSTRRTLFSNSCKCDLVVMSCFSFCLSGKAFLSPSFLKDRCLPDYVFLAGSQLLSELWAHHPLPFGPVMFLLRNLLVILRDLPSMRWVTFSRFQVSLPVFDFGLLWVLLWSPLWT